MSAARDIDSPFPLDHCFKPPSRTFFAPVPAMNAADLNSTIEAAWEARETVGLETEGAVRAAVAQALGLLDSGAARVAEKTQGGQWHVNEWLKKAVLLSFRLNDMAPIAGGPGRASWFDKVASKFDGWDEARFRAAGFRAVPNCTVRHSAYIAPGVILMPSFVNLGAYVDSGTMVDTWATVGSPAHKSARIAIFPAAPALAGFWNRLQAEPVIIEDNCFIGARSEVAEGVVVEARLGPVHGRLHRRLDQNRRPRHRRDPFRSGAGLFGRRAGLPVPGKDAGRRHTRPGPVLRRNRQTGRRKNPFQDIHK